MQFTKFVTAATREVPPWKEPIPTAGGSVEYVQPARKSNTCYFAKCKFSEIQGSENASLRAFS